MLTTDATIINAYKSPVRQVGAKVSVYDDDALITTLYHNTDLQSITIERTGETSKFFGYGVCHKVNIKVRDKERQSPIKAGNTLTIDFNSGNANNLRIAPKLFITEIHRDEITNALSITAYDMLYFAAARTAAEMAIEAPATIGDYATAAANVLGVGVFFYAENAAFDISYDAGANLDGTESIREVLDAIAEATQTIYYISRYNTLIFKTFDKDGAAAFTIDKEQYISLDSGENRRLAAICHATELGDNVEATMEQSGTKQYIRDNPFLELRQDVGELITAALTAVGGLTINQFDCVWRGNPALEIGDKIALITKDNKTVYSYLLDDVITYDGALQQQTRWKYETNVAETAENPANLGEALNKTFARVDKVNREIELVASETEENKNSIAALEINTESIAASVSEVNTNVSASLDGITEELATLTNKVEAAMTAEGVRLTIQEELTNGVDKVYTSTGFSFDADGLKISKSGSEMESKLDEDGLTIYRDDTEVLTVDNTGVNGINMTVRQYLMVGGSRFEDYGGRTGCFWIGGE